MDNYEFSEEECTRINVSDEVPLSSDNTSNTMTKSDDKDVVMFANPMLRKKEK